MSGHRKPNLSSPCKRCDSHNRLEKAGWSYCETGFLLLTSPQNCQKELLDVSEPEFRFQSKCWVQGSSLVPEMSLADEQQTQLLGAPS